MTTGHWVSQELLVPNFSQRHRHAATFQSSRTHWWRLSTASLHTQVIHVVASVSPCICRSRFKKMDETHTGLRFATIYWKWCKELEESSWTRYWLTRHFSQSTEFVLQGGAGCAVWLVDVQYLAQGLVEDTSWSGAKPVARCHEAAWLVSQTRGEQVPFIDLQGMLTKWFNPIIPNKDNDFTAAKSCIIKPKSMQCLQSSLQCPCLWNMANQSPNAPAGLFGLVLHVIHVYIYIHIYIYVYIDTNIYHLHVVNPRLLRWNWGGQWSTFTTPTCTWLSAAMTAPVLWMLGRDPAAFSAVKRWAAWDQREDLPQLWIRLLQPQRNDDSMTRWQGMIGDDHSFPIFSTWTSKGVVQNPQNRARKNQPNCQSQGPINWS